MTQTALPPRSAIAEQFTWNAPSVYASPDAWAAELKTVSDLLPGVPQHFKGHLGDGAAVLLGYFATFDDLFERVGKLYVYAGMSSSVDVTDQKASAMSGQAMALYSQFLATIAFVEPEILAIGQDTLRQWMTHEPRLAVYAHYFDDLFRKQAHVRSAEVEEVLGMAANPLSMIDNAAGVLANADLVFQPATTADGDQISVEQGNILTHLLSADRDLRRSAWESYHDGYLAHKNTFASTLSGAVKRDVFTARVRRHASALENALFPNNIPVEVFHNLIDTFRANLPTWQRYWAIRRRVLGVETLHPYDIWAPLTDDKPVVPFEQAVDWICAGMAPLGEEYVATLRRGCLEDRWIDLYPNKGKRQGAFSSGTKGTLPFIMTSYADSLNSLSTLAHELGHSMHSYLTWQNQPMIYSEYSMFVAEVASNFNQALVRKYLLDTHPEPQFQIALIEEAMSNFHRYFFIMPTLARFELEVHEREERGEGLTADSMIELMADLFGEGYGSDVHLDRPRTGITWATFNHLYANFYVFQYATGISAAHALANGVLAGQSGAVDHYLSFLKAGHSLYPLDALKLGGVDMTTPAAVETTFGVLADYVDRLDALTRA